MFPMNNFVILKLFKVMKQTRLFRLAIIQQIDNDMALTRAMMDQQQ